MQFNAYAAENGDRKLNNMPLPKTHLCPDSVEIEIHCCGVCHSDIHFIDNDWNQTDYPLVLGHEIVGKIKHKGNNVNELDEGQRVAVSWQIGACLDCEWCNKDKTHFCSNLKAIGLGGHGGFADTIILDKHFVFPLPDNISDYQAAPMLCAGATVFHALRACKVKKSMKVAVIGIGGLGHLAIQFLKAMDCEVTAFSSSSGKEKDALNFGATQFASSIKRSEILKYQNCFDLIITTASEMLDYKLFLNTLRPEGILCFLGIPKENLEIPILSLVIGQRSIIGIPLGNGNAVAEKNLIQEMFEFIIKHDIKASVEVMPMKDINLALQKVRDGKQRYRIVLENK